MDNDPVPSLEEMRRLGALELAVKAFTGLPVGAIIERARTFEAYLKDDASPEAPPESQVFGGRDT